MKIINQRNLPPKSWGGLPENMRMEQLCYDITKVKTNRYYNHYQEFFMLKMWGDKRVTSLEVQTGIKPKPKGVEVEPQPVYHAYFNTFAEAKKVAMQVYEMLADSSKYRNVFQFREKLIIKEWTDIYKTESFNLNIIDNKVNNVSINGKEVSCVRDIIKPYLEANLKGTGYVYTERKGINGEVATKRKKYVVVDINTKEIVFTVVTPYSQETFRMSNISIREQNALEEYFLGCEFVVSKIWEAKMWKKEANRKVWEV